MQNIMGQKFSNNQESNRSSGISHELPTNITFIEDEYSLGYVVTHPLLGDVSYATDRYSSFLYKIDLSNRNVMDD